MIYLVTAKYFPVQTHFKQLNGINIKGAFKATIFPFSGQVLASLIGGPWAKFHDWNSVVLNNDLNDKSCNLPLL